MTVDEIEAQLVKARADLVRIQAAVGIAHGCSDAATSGGLHGDPATLSGVRRKPNRRAEASRHAAYSREASLTGALEGRRAEIARLERALERAHRDAPVPFTPEELAAATHVRDQWGWHRVVRVSAKSVTVATEWSWTARIEMGKVLEVRAVVEVAG